MNEMIINLHMHTTYSDGSGSHADLGEIALGSRVDVLLVTDHNVLVQGVDAYFRLGKKRVLLLACEEIHDQDREPQKNHLLVFGAGQELAMLADHPQNLISAVRKAGGLSFLAHPFDQALPAFGETDISWEDWSMNGFTGMELWNGFSELKSVAHGKLEAIFYAFFPAAIPHGPPAGALQRWDDLLSKGRRVVAIGGSDAHAEHLSMGPLHKIIFPYQYHFSTINTHAFFPSDLTGNLDQDRKLVYEALAAGHCFIGCDRPISTFGFRFSAQAMDSVGIMGDELVTNEAVTLQARFPAVADVRLIKDGKCIKAVHGDTLSHVTNGAGVYRVEARRHSLGKFRGWIFSNPIYIRKLPSPK